MENNIAVIYQFSLNDNNNDQGFMNLNAQLDSFLLTCEGFLYRSVSKNDKNEWFDIVFWKDSECAYQKTGIEDQDAFKKLMGMINPESLVIQKTEIQSNVSHLAKVA